MIDCRVQGQTFKGVDGRTSLQLLIASFKVYRAVHLSPLLPCRCKPSRSQQQFHHRSVMRRPTDVIWCHWNSAIYVTSSQYAKYVARSMGIVAFNLYSRIVLNCHQDRILGSLTNWEVMLEIFLKWQNLSIILFTGGFITKCSYIRHDRT